MKIRRAQFLLSVLCASLAFISLGVNRTGAVALTNSLGLIVAVDPSGSYAITSSIPPGTFTGNLAQPLTALATDSGTDNIGGYVEITFGYTNSVNHSAAIREYNSQSAILFSDTFLAASTNDLAFPRFKTYAAYPYYLSFGSLFGYYDFGNLYPDSPWLFFDANYNSFILSPAANFMIVNNTRKSDGSLACGIVPAITNLPSGFTHQSLLVMNRGVNQTFNAWGNTLTSLTGKVRPANDAAIELNKLGYWTDHGATYYYTFNNALGYTGTLLAARDEFAAKGIPLGYLQLDSWWYPKGSSATWQGSGNGIFLYSAATNLFTNGLAAFQQQLGLPLVTHSRWIDPASPYQTQYVCSLEVCVDSSYWTNRMAYLKNAGVVTYEQDWLGENGIPATNLFDPPAYMNNMAWAAGSNGLNLQYCMPFGRHYMQGSLFNNLMTMRVSGDRFDTNEWDEFIYDSRLADSVGCWPWCDVFMSGETRNLLISTLSAGPVGVGDALGSVNAASLLQSVRPDAVIVKPDVPLLPTDLTFLNDAQGRNLPMVAATYTAHNGLLGLYVFAYARKTNNLTANFTPALLGVPGNAYVYDYFNHAGSLVTNGQAVTFTTTLPDNFAGGTYYIVVPIGPSGIGFLGDTNKFVSLGAKRLSSLSDSGNLYATIQFAAGETNVTLAGYAPAAPFVIATNGSVSSLSYDPQNRFFAVSVSPGNFGTANVTIGLPPVLQAANLAGQLQISWPVTTPPFALQSATTLFPAANWSTVTNPVVLLGNQNTVTLGLTNIMTFFRLQVN